jgi:hypothetical protein
MMPPPSLPDTWDLTLPVDPKSYGVILDRVVCQDADTGACMGTRLRCNVPLDVELWPDCTYGWGDDTEGGYLLAVNILHLWIPPVKGMEGYYGGVRQVCHSHTLFLGEFFRQRFIRHVGYWGAILYVRDIRRWLRAAKKQHFSGRIDLTRP